MIQRLRALLREERGIATMYFVVMSVGFLAVIALVVDGAGRIQANQQAYSLADGAARAAANAVSSSAILNGTSAVDPTAARAAANSWLSAAGIAGTSTIVGNRITVSITTDYDPVFLPGVYPVEATATAALITQ